ncbi:translocation/assembly module TamB domain-containing protein [Myxococcaceae bacterium GXIMD 01537]
MLGLVALLVGGGLFFLSRPSGEAWLRGKALDAAREQLAGQVEAGGVSLGLGHLTLTNLKLHDPEGALVAEVERVDAHVRLSALARGHVRIASARVVGPRLYLVQDARGLNLTRALAPREPSPPQPPSQERSHLRVDVEELVLEDGAVEFEQEGTEGVLQAGLDNLDARGKATWSAADASWSATVEATAGLTQPARGPVKLTVRAQGRETALSGDVSLSAAGLELEASAAMAGPEDVQVELRHVLVPPELARAFAPSYPLKVPVTAKGTGALSGNGVRVALDAGAGSATLDVDGDFNLATWRTQGLTARARGVNLAQLMENGPVTALSADLSARGGGLSLESLEGAVELKMSPSRFKGQALGPVELRASAQDGRLELSRLRALVPGAALTASGGGTLQSLQVKGNLTASDLATLARTVGHLGRGQPLPLSGSGALEFTLRGPARTPGLRLSGGFASLAYADTAVEGLSLKADVPDVTRPFSTDAEVRAQRLSTGGRTFQDVSATVTTGAERALDAQVRVQGDAQLALSLRGTVDENGQGLTARTLELSYPEATWKLRQPVHLGFGERVEVAPVLALTSGEQSLALTLALRGTRLESSSLDVKALDLGKLPRLFVPESLGLGGVLNGRVTARGTLPRPDAQVDLTLKDGRYQRYSGLDATLQGRYVRDRATGTLSATVPGASASADFDVPVQGVLRRRREPLNLTVNLTRVDLGPALETAGQAGPLRGQLSGQLQVTGLAREPRVALTLRGESLRQEGPDAFVLPHPLAFTLNAGTDDADGTLDGRLEVEGLGSRTVIALRTPYTTSQLLDQPPTQEQLLQTPVELEANLDDVPLSLLGAAAQENELSGQVSVKLKASGSVLLPEGTMELEARGVSAHGTPPLDGRVSVAASGPEVRITASTGRPGEAALAQLTAVLEAPLGALQDREVIDHVPFQLRVRGGPVALKELPFLDRPNPAQGLQGVLSLEMNAAGTLASPRLHVQAGLQRLGVGALALGQARAHYRYDAARSTLDTLLTAPDGGTLLVHGTAKLDLSLPALQRGVEPLRAPMEAQLVARNFDVGFLSGASQSVRTLAGTLSADATLGGSVQAPTLRGDVEWKNGRLGLMGLGEYRDIHVAVGATQERIQVRELFARAGAGELRMTADATLSRGGTFALSGQAQAKDFPIVFDDQLLAIATLRAQMEGDLSSALVHIRSLTIPEAHIELPEVRRKDLQPLDRPPDVVLVRNGVPLERRRRRQQQQAAREQQQFPGPVQPVPPPGAESLPPPEPPAAVPPAPGQEPAKAPAPPSEEQEAVRRYLVNVNAPRNLWVRGSDVNVELGLSEDFRIEYDEESRLYGEVNVLRGRVDVLGRRFDVQADSQVRFTGPPRTPYINVTAQHRNDREDVTVFVTIRGQGKEFTIKPTSDPPLPESEIYTLLATGRRNLRANSGASMTGTQQAASIVGSLVASQARKALSEKLPLDVFSIEAAEGGLAGAKLEVGTYVTDQIYVGYTGRVGATTQERESANAVRVEYQFHPRWGLQAQCGDAPACAFDLIWGNEY